MSASLPCIACGRELADAFPDQTINQPYCGTVFRSGGQYGSTIFDPIDTGHRLEINICDSCLALRSDRVLLITPDPMVKGEHVSAWPVSEETFNYVMDVTRREEERLRLRSS